MISAPYIISQVKFQTAELQTLRKSRKQPLEAALSLRFSSEELLDSCLCIQLFLFETCSVFKATLYPTAVGPLIISAPPSQEKEDEGTRTAKVQADIPGQLH